MRMRCWSSSNRLSPSVTCASRFSLTASHISRAKSVRMKHSPYPEQTTPTVSSHHTPAPGTLHRPPLPLTRIQLPPLLPATTISSSCG